MLHPDGMCDYDHACLGMDLRVSKMALQEIVNVDNTTRMAKSFLPGPRSLLHVASLCEALHVCVCCDQMITIGAVLQVLHPCSMICGFPHQHDICKRWNILEHTSCMP